MIFLSTRICSISEMLERLGMITSILLSGDGGPGLIV